MHGRQARTEEGVAVSAVSRVSGCSSPAEAGLVCRFFEALRSWFFFVVGVRRYAFIFFVLFG